MTKIKAPWDSHAEAALIGDLLYRGQPAFDEIEGLVGLEDFFEGRHRNIFGAVEYLCRAGEFVDPTTVATRLANTGRGAQVGGVEDLIAIMNATAYSTSTALRAYARSVRSKAKLRRVIELAQKLQAEAYEPMEDVDEFVGRAERELGGIVEEGSEDDFASLKEAAVEAARELTERSKRGGRPEISTGFVDLDATLGGLWRTDLTVVAGRPGSGKTSFAMNVVSNAVAPDPNAAALVFSLEMPRRQLAMRMMCSEANQSVALYRRGVTPNWPALAAAGQKLGTRGIYFDDRPQPTLDTLRGKIKRKTKALAREGKRVSVVVVDYLQLMKMPDTDNIARAIGDITAGLKGLAKELEIAVIAISQLNRKCEDRKDKRPMISDLRESGAIEQDADNILFVYRDELYGGDQGTAEIIVAKQRNGPAPATVHLAFRGESTTFHNLTQERDAAE